MQKFIYLFITVQIIVFNHSPAFCETLYSLHDIALLANKQSETIKIAKEEVFIAKQDKQRALSVMMPRATAYGAMTKYKEEDFAAPDTLTMGVKLTQSFTINGKELIAYNVTKNIIEGKEFSLEAIRSQYLLQVAQAYFNILSAQRFFEIAQSDVKRLTTYKDAVKEKLIVGNVTKTDLYRAKAELSKAMTEHVKTENIVLQAKALLQNLVEIDENFNLKKNDIIKNSDLKFSLDEIQTYALKNRPEIKEANNNLEVARKTIKFNKSDYWPELSLEAGYKETDIEYDSFPNNIRYDTEDVYFSGELVFTLYDGGLRKAQIKQAVADFRKAKNALSLQKKQIILEAKVNFLDNKAAQSALLNLQDELKSARENFNAVTMQFKYGMADSINIMDANTLLVSAQRRISDAEYIHYLSILKILYTKGELNKFLLDGKSS
jgi:outer membrane protein TolC